jgi:phage gp29-like protein
MNNNLTRELVSRTNQLSFFKYIGILPNPDKLLSGSERNTKKYKELINEPHLWSCIQSRKSGVLSHSYQIIQNNSPTSTFEFIKNNFAQIDTNKLIREMLDAVLYGFQPFEIIWKEICYNARILFIIERIEARPQEYFVYDLKGKLKIKSFTKPQGNSIPNFKIINVQLDAKYENPY